MKTQTLKSIEILETKEVQCRFEVLDDVAFTRTVHYEVLSLSTDITLQSSEVQAACASCWTPELMLAKTADIVAQSVVTAANQAKADADKAACDVACKEAEEAKSSAEAATVEANAATAALTEANTRLKAAQDEAKTLSE